MSLGKNEGVGDSAYLFCRGVGGQRHVTMSSIC